MDAIIGIKQPRHDLVLGADDLFLPGSFIAGLVHVLLPLLLAPVAAQFEFGEGVVVRRDAGPLLVDLHGASVARRPSRDVARPVRPLLQAPLHRLGWAWREGFAGRAHVAILTQIGPAQRSFTERIRSSYHLILLNGRH